MWQRFRVDINIYVTISYCGNTIVLRRTDIVRSNYQIKMEHSVVIVLSLSNYRLTS